MPCPDCRSHNLWDDQSWWGCQDCGFGSSTIHNTVDSRDRFNEPLSPRHIAEKCLNKAITLEGFVNARDN